MFIRMAGYSVYVEVKLVQLQIYILNYLITLNNTFNILLDWNQL